MSIFNLVFDLDDTLVPNSYRYSQPALKCAIIICRELRYEAPYFPLVIEQFQALDTGRVKECGFSRTRFPTSWVLMYEQCCRNAGVEPSQKVRQELLQEASRFAQGPFDVFPGTFDALGQLRAAGHRLHLLTAGDTSLQQEKIDQSCVAKCFDSVNIVHVDKKTALAGLAGEDRRGAAMIGDSKKSDILPAVELGMRAVWVPSNTWDYAHADLAVDDHHVIKSIADLPDLVASWG